MGDYFHILYVRIRPAAVTEQYPEDITRIRDWTWEQTPYVRWKCVNPSQLDRQMIGEANLVVLDWPSKQAADARAAFAKIRSYGGELRLLVVKCDSGRDAMLDETILSKLAYVRGISLEEVLSQDSIAAAFAALEVYPPKETRLEVAQ